MDRIKFPKPVTEQKAIDAIGKYFNQPVTKDMYMKSAVWRSNDYDDLKGVTLFDLLPDLPAISIDDRDGDSFIATIEV